MNERVHVAWKSNKVSKITKFLIGAAARNKSRLIGRKNGKLPFKGENKSVYKIN